MREKVRARLQSKGRIKVKSLILLVLSFCFSVSLAIAGPNVVVYRYQAVDVKTLPGKIITGESISIDPWIRNDAKWPKGRKTAVLVHGFPRWNKGDCRAGMIGLAMHLSQARKVGNKTLLAYNSIYVVEYPTGFSLTETAGTLASIVNERCSDWPITERIDIFAHSMGGLISRAAIECSKEVLGANNTGSKVLHLVMMGTPQNGFEKIKVFKEVLGNPIELEDMDIKSDFLRNTLNSLDTKRLKTTKYYVAYGTCSYKPKLFKQGLKRIGDSLYGAHDGLVAVSSSSYDLLPFCQSYQAKAFELNHDYLVKDSTVFGQIDQWMVSDAWFSAAPTTTATTPTPSLPKITKFTGGVPILLGKTKAEVVKIMGKTVDNYYDQDLRYVPFPGLRHYWRYNYAFEIKVPWTAYRVTMDFAKYDQADANDGKVHSVVYMPALAGGMSTKQFVPKEVLAIKPDIIAPGDAEGRFLVIIWFIDNKTFCLSVNDFKRKLFDVVKAGQWPNETIKCYLNDNGRDFVHCDNVWTFIVIDQIVNISNPEVIKMYGSPGMDALFYYPDGRMGFTKFKD